MPTVTCPYCGSGERQVKNERHPLESQRYLCRVHGRKYPPEPTVQGYPLALIETFEELTRA